MNDDYLLLKWGTVKSWSFETKECEAFKLLQEYMQGSSIECIYGRPDEERKKLLCKIIDSLNGEIENDWEGEMMTKEEAKKYVMEYGSKDE